MFVIVYLFMQLNNAEKNNSPRLGIISITIRIRKLEVECVIAGVVELGVVSNGGYATFRIKFGHHE